MLPTLFQEIFDIFLDKVKDYTFLSLTAEDMDTLLSGYLKSAIVKFKKSKVDLSYDPHLMQFNNELGYEEMEILAMLMCVEYITPQIMTTEILKQTLASKDYQMFSQAQHLKELKDLRKQLRAEINSLINNYTYDNGDLGKLK
jgi:hypothetical protein